MGLYRRGKFYWLSISFQGKRVQISLKTDNKRLAEKLHAKVLTDMVEGRFFEREKARSITFDEMAINYMKKYRKQRDDSTLKRLLPYFGATTLSDVTAEAVEDYILARAKEGAKPATVYKEYALGRRMFNVARKKWKWVSANPFADVGFSELLKIDNARVRWLTVRDEKTSLDSATPAYLKDVIVFAIHSGCRRGEILSLCWKPDVDLGRKLITLKASKGGRIKAIPMSETLYRMLLKRSKVRHISGKVFPIKVTALKDAFERAVKKAAIEDFHFHDLRHTFATRLVQAGVDLYSVKNLLGHRSIKMTERYAHHYPESLRPSVRALDECYIPATLSGAQEKHYLQDDGKNL